VLKTSAAAARVMRLPGVPGICEKPRIKCADCLNRAFLPVTDEVIRCHLSGKDPHGKDFVAGVYPMLADETSHFLAINFDKESWCENVLAVMANCRSPSTTGARWR